jgi:hypothetical protein
MLTRAGPDLDRQIERKLNGDAKKRTPPYSTSEKAANRLLRRLELQDMPCTVELIDAVWFCTFWTAVADSRERLSTGSGETRALAIARAVMNARLGMNSSLSKNGDQVSNRVHWGHVSRTAEVESCDVCGAALPARHRESPQRLCSVCAWREARFPVTPRMNGTVKEIRVTRDESGSAEKPESDG